MTGHSRHIANASQSYTFASRTSQRTDQSLQKSMPAQPHSDRQTDDRKEQRRHNSSYKKLAAQWLDEAFPQRRDRSCFVSSFVVAESFVLRNRQLLVAANRYSQC